ncbi:2-succinylbenzoate--CoA ligase [Gloeocapsopsis dulcis]|uniref:2-succinylbenzoate-CoA ligase n=1 Tax=Gloeocapsopsis dulcis AAB1 = 1H9 TaxID=1433147 RepID=A0A6N8FVR3_9CHRO|nr:2-succinylbenzoate--CoA ligase [Gloeocapsopsis dulcis]MUL36247.1 2-succinylbenzoate-CoA ligase [Gloeocapsopsis dulcis AAB1 = 1H9]WNN89640.1 2-succinylbenzoate--CoA ligase [Gloeocapsopsis dulcis]
MEYSLEDFENYTKNHLLCENSDRLPQLTEEIYLQITQSRQTSKVLLAERDPTKFLASFIAACAAGYPVFLCNPDWGQQEWQQVLSLVQPDIILASDLEKILFNSQNTPTTNYQLPITNPIMIPTGGSSGKIKFAIHTWETLTASVTGFRKYFQVQQVNSYCVLPLYHVSGLMQFMRSFTSGGKLVIQNFKQLEQEIYHINSVNFFISLVPTQLQQLLQARVSDRLAQFQTVLLGGAPAWNEILAEARSKNISLALTYGMTETASQIATLKPEDFLQGKHNCGKILPHAKVEICNAQNQIGNIKIQSASLALGYYPNIFTKAELTLDDLGYFDAQGYLNIIGRSSNKIISGGENIYPVEIEAAIHNTQLVKDICIIGIPDRHWGQAVTAIYVPKSTTSITTLQTTLKNKLSKFKIPKHWIPLTTLPRNSQGKINRQHLQQLATTLLQEKSL